MSAGSDHAGRVSGAFAAALFAAMPIATTAPSTAVAADVLEEVIVTARKRDESLQQTPVAVTALSGEALAAAGLRDIIKLAEVVPNLTFNTGGGGGGAVPNIRGVGARNNGANFDNGVAIYLDGVYFSRVDGAILDSVDIRDVQVLRGPQGTLFGKNATGGAIIYTTNKPADLFEGNVELDYGNYDRLNGKMTVNMPLVDDALYSRFSLFSTRRDGFVEDVASGRDFGDEDRWGGQGQLRWLAGESVLVDLDGRYTSTDQTTKGYQCQPSPGVPGSGWLTGLQDSTIIIPSTGRSFLEHCRDSSLLDKDRIYTPFSDELPPKYESRTRSVAATVDWELTDSLSLKSISSWRNIEAGEANDLWGLAIPFQTRTNFGRSVTRNRDTDWYSQEFQLNGNAFDGRLDYVTGLFVSREKTGAGNAAGVAGPFFNALGVPTLASYLAQATELRTDNKAYAAFSQVDWNITEVWRLTLGLRYTWEQRQLQRTTWEPDLSGLSTGAPATNVTGPIYAFPDGEGSFNPDHGYVFGESQTRKIDNDDWNPMASIQYLFEGGDSVDDGTVYATVATGFLSGGLAESPDFLTGEIPEYKPEKATNFEVGLKLDAYGRSLRVNTALFHTKYDDRQLTGIGVNPQNGTISSVTTNAAKSTITGVELETLWLPLENLGITFNFTANEGDIKKFTDTTVAVTGELPPADCETANIGPGLTVDGCTVDRSGEDLPRLPAQTYYLAVNYRWETAYGAFTPLLDATYKKDISNCFDWASCQWKNGKGMRYDFYALNARLSWRSADESVRVTVYGNNLTDNQAAEGGNPLIGASDSQAVEWSAPRTYGIQLSYAW